MKKMKLLPLLAIRGVIQNGQVYYPYIAAGIFSVFTYFAFASILCNDIIATLPKSAYAWMMLSIGKVLLAIILLFFLIYANSFLVKRRQKEFGLYNILGLEKKHIAGIMLMETVFLYAVVMIGGVLLGVVLTKLLFLLLLRMSGMPADVHFTFELQAFRETAVFYAGVFLVNYAEDLRLVGKAKPVELMSGGRRGEKEPRFLAICAILGAAALGFGYWTAVTAKMDSMIFINFFLAVFLVIVGTYLLFTSGSIAALKFLRSRKGIYYNPKNFITISGMLYRMKKSAASLSNICIFSTMVIITLICTISLYAGMNDMIHFVCPYDMTVHFRDGKVDQKEVEQKISELEDKYGIAVQRVDIYDSLGLSCRQDGNAFIIREGDFNYANDYKVSFLTLEEYKEIENLEEGLSENEVFIYCSGRDFGYDSVNFFGKELRVKEELQSFFPKPKAEQSLFSAEYIIIVKDWQIKNDCIRVWAKQNGVEEIDAFLDSDTRYVNILLQGKDEEKTDLLNEFAIWCQARPGFSKYDDGVDERASMVAMYGGLLFIGVLFGVIFFMCLILIMYYKQIQEGYEDQGGFNIMKKVGMSDREIRSTVHRQIIMVFGLPLIGAVLHTMAGMHMVQKLMAVIDLFNWFLMAWCTVGVVVLFVLVYGISYAATSKVYYQIVKQSQ